MMNRYTDKSQRIEEGPGSVFQIALKSNPSTGYTWTASIHPSILVQIGDVKTEGLGSEIGADVNEIFTFKVIEAGQSTIAFSYCRIWKPEDVRGRIEFEVLIR